MKKIISTAVAITLLVLFAFTGCSTSRIAKEESSSAQSEATTQDSNNTGEGVVDDLENNESNDGAVDAEGEKTNFDENEVVNNIKVTPYTYNNDYEHCLVAVLENKSTSDCELTISVDFLDSNNNIVGTEEKTVDAFQSGTEVAEKFNCDEKFAKYKYTLETSELSYYEPVTRNLECQVSPAKEKAIVSAKNNGDVTAEYTEYTVLFFKNNKLVSSDWGYIGDNNSEIKPGKTYKQEVSCYEKFDYVKAYLNSRAAKEY